MNWEPFPMSLTDASLGKIVCNFWNVMDHYYLDKPSPDQEGKQRKYEDGQTTSIRFKVNAYKRHVQFYKNQRKYT